MKIKKTVLDHTVEKTFDTVVIAIMFIGIMLVCTNLVNEYLYVVGAPFRTVLSIIIMAPIFVFLKKFSLWLLK